MIIKLLDNQSDVNVGTFEAQLSVADMFAETIRRVVENESSSSQYLV